MDRQIDRKRAAIAGAVGLVVLGMGLPARAVNLLLNPGFENPDTTQPPPGESTTAANWIFYPAGNEERVSTSYNSLQHSGQWSVFQKLFLPQGSVYQTVGGIVAGSAYTLTGWEYAQSNIASTNGTLDFELTWENGTGAQVGTPSILNIPLSTLTIGAFKQFTLNAVAPTSVGATQVLVSFDHTSPGGGSGECSTFLDDVDLEGAGTVPANAWGIDGSGDWNIAGNWSAGVIPNGAGQEADFFVAITNAHNVYSDVAVTAGTLNFNNGHTYVIDGAGSLTLQGAGSNGATVIVQAGTQEINLPLTIASNTVFNVSSGATLVIGNPTTVDSPFSLSQSGLGTVTYNSIVTVQTGASISFGNSTYAHGLTLQGTGAATLASHTGSTQTVLQLDSLTGSGTSKLDLTNNALVVHCSPLTVSAITSAITTELKTGFNAGSGYWNGAGGIVSSAAASDTKHLTTLGSRQSAGGTFDGVSTTTSDVLVKYTYYGDANLDGSVNGADYQQIDLGFGSHLTGWQNGDFNYDGVVDGSDFSLIDNTFNQLNAGSTSPLAITAGSADLIASPASTVPEPATLSLLGIGAIGLLGRRSRKVV